MTRVIDRLVTSQILALMREGYGVEDIAIGLDVRLEDVRFRWRALKSEGLLDELYRSWRAK